MINIKDFDLSLLKIDKKSYTNIGIYHIAHLIVKQMDTFKQKIERNT